MTQELDDIRQELHELQSQFAFQEDTVQSLNEALALQQQEILVMRRQLELLKQNQEERQSRPGEGAQGSLLDEKPPHY